MHLFAFIPGSRCEFPCLVDIFKQFGESHFLGDLFAVHLCFSPLIVSQTGTYRPAVQCLCLVSSERHRHNTRGPVSTAVCGAGGACASIATTLAEIGAAAEAGIGIDLTVAGAGVALGRGEIFGSS